MTASIEPLGDCALLIQLGAQIDAQLNEQALALAAAIYAARLPGVLDVAPAYASVCVRYAPAQPDACERLAAAIRPLVESATPAASASTGSIEIPVCYGGEFGPDLDEVARRAQLEPDEMIARHAGADYRVAMLGFAPGFPYLLGLPGSLHAPRRGSPRTRVPTGAVAIGGAQTGIYPRELPGGWNIIGRTPLRLFDIDRDAPALLTAGRHVRFRAIDAAEFAALAR